MSQVELVCIWLDLKVDGGVGEEEGGRREERREGGGEEGGRESSPMLRGRAVRGEISSDQQHRRSLPVRHVPTVPYSGTVT